MNIFFSLTAFLLWFLECISFQQSCTMQLDFISQMFSSTVFLKCISQLYLYLGLWTALYISVRFPATYLPYLPTLSRCRIIWRKLSHPIFGHQQMRSFGTHEKRQLLCRNFKSPLDVIVKLHMTNGIQHLSTLRFDSAMVYHWSHTSVKPLQIAPISPSLRIYVDALHRHTYM